MAKLEAAVERSGKLGTEETGRALVALRTELLGALVEDTSELVKALAAANANTVVVPIDDARYFFGKYPGFKKSPGNTRDPKKEPGKYWTKKL